VRRLAPPGARATGDAGLGLRKVLPGTSLFLKMRNMRFYYAYVLRNPQRDFIYIGYSENLRQRFSEHSAGYSKSTKAYTPLELIHYEAYTNRKDAKHREKYLKTNRGRTTIVTMLKSYFS